MKTKAPNHRKYNQLGNGSNTAVGGEPDSGYQEHGRRNPGLRPAGQKGNRKEGQNSTGFPQGFEISLLPGCSVKEFVDEVNIHGGVHLDAYAHGEGGASQQVY